MRKKDVNSQKCDNIESGTNTTCNGIHSRQLTQPETTGTVLRLSFPAETSSSQPQEVRAEVDKPDLNFKTNMKILHDITSRMQILEETP